MYYARHKVYNIVIERGRTTRPRNKSDRNSPKDISIFVGDAGFSIFNFSPKLKSPH